MQLLGGGAHGNVTTSRLRYSPARGAYRPFDADRTDGRLAAVPAESMGVFDYKFASGSSLLSSFPYPYFLELTLKQNKF